MSGRQKPEAIGQTMSEVERPVIWTGVVPPPRWFGGRGGWLDLVNLVMVAVLLVNLYFGTWIISVLLVTAIMMRWWLLRRQSRYLGGPIEHEISPKGIRRGDKHWEWDEFSAWTVLKTRNPGVLDLVLRRAGGSHLHIDMPESALPYVEPMLNKRLVHYVP